MRDICSRKTAQAMRIKLCCTTSILGLALTASPVWAQQTEDLPAEADVASEGGGQIVVTGSRIRTDGIESPVPITVVTADNLEAASPGAMIEGLAQLPQFYGSQTPNSSGSWFLRGGYGNLDLRGLGINRTLTLLNGRRMISSTAFGGVDINAFPEAATQTVETVTGGASAAYGSDAVAGVVNFILDTNFTGLEVSAQGGMTDRSDGDNYEVSAIFGMDIGDRGHIIVSGEMYDFKGIHDYSGRDWYQSYGTVADSNNMLVTAPRVYSNGSTFDGLIFAPGRSINGMNFQPDGSLVPLERGALASGTLGTPPARSAGGTADDLGAPQTTLYPDVKRDSIFAYADYEVTDDVTVFAQYIRGHNSTFRYNSPTASLQGTPTAITIFQDNAFLPASLRQTMIDEGITSFTLRRMGSVEDIGANISLQDDNLMNSATAGFEWEIDSNGAFLDGWNVGGYYQYGHNRRRWNQVGLRVDRVFAAVDAVDEGLVNTGTANGNIVCRVALFGDAFPGCEPLNLFGRGNASAAAVDYVIGNDVGEQITTPLYFADSGFSLGLTDSYTSQEAKVNLTTLEQHVGELNFSGDLFEGWAGAIATAFGASYRRESIVQVVRDSTNQSSDHDSGHPVLCNGEAPGLRGVSGADCANTVGIQYSKVSNIRGSGAVKEAYAEVLVPLIDGGIVDSMVFNAAGRVADYSGSGTVWAYKVGLDVAVIPSLRLRGTYSRDVRAANLSERFDKTGGVATLDDPRTPVIEAINVTRFSGGNPAVNPEEADTFTGGFIFQPEFIPGLSMSVDYYDISINGAIGQLGSQGVLDGCLIDNVSSLCDLVTLDSGGVPILVGDVFINIDTIAVRGVDAELNYMTDVSLIGGADETIGLRGFASWLLENSRQFAGSPAQDRAGQTGIQQSDGVGYALPDFKATAQLTYNNGGFSAFLQGRYIGEGTLENALIEGVNIDDNTVDSVVYLDLRLGYEFNLGSSRAELFGSITNLTDTDPPVTPYFSAFTGRSSQYNPNVFDVLGRRYTVGVKFTL